MGNNLSCVATTNDEKSEKNSIGRKIEPEKNRFHLDGAPSYQPVYRPGPNGYEPIITTISKNIHTNKPLKNSIKNMVVKHSNNVGNAPVKTKLQLGQLFIFSNEKFDKQLDRYGTEKDVAALEEAFKSFNVKTTIYRQQTKKSMCAKMKTFKKMDFSSYAAIFIAILSHGNRSYLIEATDEPYDLNDVVFQPLIKNTTLEGKKKVIIIQACRGTIDPARQALRKYVTDGPTYQLPKNFIILNSTFEGYVAYRHPVNGSEFIQMLSSIIKDHGRTMHLEDMFKKLQADFEKKNLPQAPVLNTTSFDKFYFWHYC